MPVHYVMGTSPQSLAYQLHMVAAERNATKTELRKTTSVSLRAWPTELNTTTQPRLSERSRESSDLRASRLEESCQTLLHLF